jgi:superfamily II DNA/RNA helicase
MFGDFMAARRPSTRPASRTTDTTPTVPAPAAVPAVEHDPAPATDATFAQLGVPAALTAVLSASGITAPFPIQTATLPDSLAGRDVLGRGRTGSGKTLAFVLPVLARLAASGAPRQPYRPRALILAPTRELATQIHATIAPLAEALRLRSATVFGGVGARPQIVALRGGLDILVACPGRLADHIGTRNADLSAVEIAVLDEADHMADLGFLPVVKRLLDQTPAGGQRLLFSATLDGGVDEIVRRYLRNPVTHSVDSAQSPVAAMTHHVLHIESEHRLPVLIDLAAAPGRTILFTRTKHGAKKLTKQLLAARIPAVELHGNLAQNARTRNLAAFADGRATTLVATDIAARGIHVDDVALVVHADPPVEHKAYLHRSGRTARAGAAGTVITLMTTDQRSEVRDLTRKAGITPTTTKLEPGDAFLLRLAPGERVFSTPEETAALLAPAEPASAPRSGAKPEQAAGRRGAGRRPGGPAQSPARDGRAQAPDAAEPGARQRGAGKQGGGAKQGGAKQQHQQQSGGASRQGGAKQSGSTQSGSTQSGSNQGGSNQSGQGTRTGQGGRGKPGRGGGQQSPGRPERGAEGSADGRAAAPAQPRQQSVAKAAQTFKPKRGAGAVSLSERASSRVGGVRRGR